MIEAWLRWFFLIEKLAGKRLGEKFTRFHILTTPWFNIYLHKLEAPNKHPHCHDHPWHFWTLLLFGGYWETLKGKTYWRNPGDIMFRPAKTKHNVVTKGVSWSIILTSGRIRKWRIIEEEDADCRSSGSPMRPEERGNGGRTSWSY